MNTCDPKNAKYGKLTSVIMKSSSRDSWNKKSREILNRKTEKNNFFSRILMRMWQTRLVQFLRIFYFYFYFRVANQPCRNHPRGGDFYRIKVRKFRGIARTSIYTQFSRVSRQMAIACNRTAPGGLHSYKLASRYRISITPLTLTAANPQIPFLY